MPSRPLVLGLSPGAATAQTFETGFADFGTDNDAPIEIEADTLEVQDRDNVAVFTGNVTVTQKDAAMQTARLTVHYARNPQDVRRRGRSCHATESAHCPAGRGRQGPDRIRRPVGDRRDGHHRLRCPHALPRRRRDTLPVRQRRDRRHAQDRPRHRDCPGGVALARSRPPQPRRQRISRAAEIAPRPAATAGSSGQTARTMLILRSWRRRET